MDGKMIFENVILIGFMGAGKTEIGKKLAEKLKMTYMDTDSLIEKEQGMSINDIFKESGEACFRDVETKVLDSLKGTKKCVVSTGGGMILRPRQGKKTKAMAPLVLFGAAP